MNIGMNIEEIDKNFSFESKIDREGLVWYDARKSPFCIHGLHKPQDASLPFHRMPMDLAKSISPRIDYLNHLTAGGRLTFATNSPFLAIRCETVFKITLMKDMAFSGSQGFDLYTVTDQGTLSYVTSLMAPPARIGEIGYEVIAELPKDGAVRRYVLNFPLYGSIKNLALGIHGDAVLKEHSPYKYEKPIVFYGSSITQGGCASRPGACYQALLTAEFGFDYINLGFAGNAKGEPEMADYLASLDPLIFVCDYDFNAPNLDHLKKTLPPLYETFRRAHPETPFIFISSPGMKAGKATHDFIAETADKVIRGGDKNAYFIDGAPMFDLVKPHACTVDSWHPTDLGFYCMYRAIAPILAQILSKTTD